jgi:hypothetical protein
MPIRSGAMQRPSGCRKLLPDFCRKKATLKIEVHHEFERMSSLELRAYISRELQELGPLIDLDAEDVPGEGEDE